MDIDTQKPLKFSRKIKAKDGEISIHLNYELLFKHCSYCGIMTHEIGHCEKKASDIKVEFLKK